MKVQLAIALTVALAAAGPLEIRQAKGSPKGSAKGSGGAPGDGPGTGGNEAMKNGWPPQTKAPSGMGTEPCLAAVDCDYSHLTMNDLISGECKAITFIFARATTELGNMGAAAGSGVARYLTGHYGNASVAVQGVKYPADMMGNMAAGGCSAAGISEAVRLFNMANTKCPNTIITAGGYSQGTACMHRSIPKLTAAVQQKIVGVVLFGDTQAAQTSRKISGLTPEKVKIYCNSGDAVCTGTLMITQAHFQYTPFVAPATQFLISQIDARRGSTGGSAPTAAPPAPPAGEPEPASAPEPAGGE